MSEITTLLGQLSVVCEASLEMSPNMTTKEFINHEVEFDLNNPYQPFDEELMKMSNLSNPRTFVQDEDDIQPLIVEHVAPMC